MDAPLKYQFYKAMMLYLAEHLNSSDAVVTRIRKWLNANEINDSWVLPVQVK